MFSQYWVANIPGTTISSSEGERIAVVGRKVGSTVAAANIGRLGGSSLAIPIKISTAIGAVTHMMNIAVAPSTSVRNVVCTALASSEGVAVNAAGNKGYLGIQCVTSTGGTVKRYILLYTS